MRKTSSTETGRRAVAPSDQASLPPAPAAATLPTPFRRLPGQRGGHWPARAIDNIEEQHGAASQAWRTSRGNRFKLNAMTFDEVRLLVDYNYWARDRLLDAVSALMLEQFTRDLGNSFGSVRDTIAHICDAESVWVRRWEGGLPTGFQSPARLPDLAAARAEWADLERRMREVLSQLGPEGVGRTLEYKDLRGAPRSDVFWQVLQHVVNHGSYHRGQVTTMLRQLGAAPPKYMDLIVFYRELQTRT